MTTNNRISRFIILTKRYLKIYLGISVFVFLFILFFQPFSGTNFEFENMLLFITGFGFIVFISLLAVQMVFQRHLFQVKKSASITDIYVPLYFFTQVIITSLAFIFYIRFVGQCKITFNVLVKVIFICLSLPVTIFVKNKYDSYKIRLKRLIHTIRLMQNKLKQFSETYEDKFVELVSESDSDNIRILVSDIVYVKSSDNYVEVGYQDEGIFKKKMIRNTLRNIEQQLKEFNNFIRTHRTSVVNIQYINKLNKSFNNYWLSLDNTKESIPVSRQYLLSVKDTI